MHCEVIEYGLQCRLLAATKGKVHGQQELLRHICANGFEHHVAGTLATVADSVHEAATRYLGWDVLRHR